MAQQPVQNFENHTRLFPLFHYVTLPILALNLIYSAVHLYRVVSGGTFYYGAVASLAVAIALITGFLSARIFALTVQDRVIRLEMRLRMERLLPADLKPRIGDFTVAQFVSLRFASDAELPELARKVLADNIQDRKTIKKMVKNWQGDFLRA